MLMHVKWPGFITSSRQDEMPFLKQRIHFKQCELWLVLDIKGLILSQEKVEWFWTSDSGVTLACCLTFAGKSSLTLS